MSVKVIVDTSFLMVPGIFKVDVLSEMERLFEAKPKILVPTPVIRELERISEEGNPRERSAARVAMELARRGEEIDAEAPADLAIQKLAEELNCAVGTTDAALKKKLRQRGLPVIFLRGKSHLAVDGKV